MDTNSNGMAPVTATKNELNIGADNDTNKVDYEYNNTIKEEMEDDCICITESNDVESPPQK